MVALFIIGVIIVLEFIVGLFRAGRSASGLTYFICRPFGIPFSMIIGFIVRIALIALAVFFLTKSIPAIF